MMPARAATTASEAKTIKPKIIESTVFLFLR
jgi:hypothetical protein